MLQEFDISITAVGNDQYLVRTEQVAPGVPLAQEQFCWPIDQWLSEASTLMHDPLLGILKGESSQRWASRTSFRSGKNADKEAIDELPTLVSLGQALYNSLFDKALRDSWLTAQGVAQNRRSPLRLRLGLKGEKLQQLPWEVLHAGDRPLGTGTDVTFSRYHLNRRQGYDRPVPTVPDFDQPLRVLMVIAAPNDQDRLELAREVKHLQNELHPASTRSGRSYGVLPKKLDVQLTVLEQPGRAELTQALEQGNYQALHYAGHSNLGNAGGDLYLVSRQTGLTERISGEDLAGLLSNNGVKLAVLNSCRGAYSQGASEAGWHEQNLAHALVNRGIPGVIAMAERIPDDVAITFTQLLYRNLRQGNPIDLCLNRTRQGLISAHGSHYSYWALPILYMQPGFDGYLASQPGTDDSALDKLLIESESALKTLDRPAAVGAADADSAPAGPESTDLDNLVETVELDEFLSYDDDDPAAMTELVETLSQPSEPDQVKLADVDESLIPEPLETPGLDLYERLPKKPVESAVDEAEPSETIYEDASPVIPEPGGQNRSGPSKRRKQQVAIGIGAAALLGLAGVGISDPLNWFAPSPSTPTIETSSEPDVSSPVITGTSTADVQQLEEMAAASNQDAAIAQIDALPESTTNPSLLFMRGQLQWDLMREIPLNDVQSIEEQASNAAVTWGDALGEQPNWVDAQVAIGFAYYERGSWDEAIEMWTAAIEKGRRYEESAKLLLLNGGQRTNVHSAPMQVHAQAGLAMVYARQAEEQTVESLEKERLRSLALDSWKTVLEIAEDQNFTANGELPTHWLWSEKALEDWQKAYGTLVAYADETD